MLKLLPTFTLIIYLIAASAISKSLKAQTTNYLVSASNETLQIDTLNSITLNNSIWDDNFWQIPLGSSFTINNQSFDTIVVSSNGEIFFGSLLQLEPDTSANTFYVFSGFGNVFQGADLIDRGARDSIQQSRSRISTKQISGFGGWITFITWENAGLYNNFSNTDSITFQITLNHFSGEILTHIGTHQIGANAYKNSNGPVIGIAAYNQNFDPSSGTGTFLSGNPSSYSLVSNFSTLNSTPAQNTKFTFIPVPLSARSNKLINSKLYPNPAKDFFMVDVLSDNSHLQVFNLQGQLVHSEALQIERTKVDVSMLKSGVYFVNISYPNAKTETHKLVVY